jgi:hypothetical protein
MDWWVHKYRATLRKTRNYFCINWHTNRRAVRQGRAYTDWCNSGHTNTDQVSLFRVSQSKLRCTHVFRARSFPHPSQSPRFDQPNKPPNVRILRSAQIANLRLKLCSPAPRHFFSLKSKHHSPLLFLCECSQNITEDNIFIRFGTELPETCDW